MSLRFILGKPGAGKTAICHNEMLALQQAEAEGKDAPPGYLIYIVPEQFSMQSEKELVKRSQGRGLVKIQVLSFQRLAYHVFSEMGGNDKKIMEDLGKNMLLRKIVYELRQELKFFASAVDKQGFIEQLSNIVTEFYQYGFTEEALDATIHKIENNQALKLKLSDLSLILSRYAQYQRENYLSNDEILDVLSNKIEQSGFIRGIHVWIDGFTGFTPQEYKIVSKLLQSATQVNIALSVDKYAEGDCQKTEFFYETKKTIRKLNLLAAEQHIQIEEPLLLSRPQRYRSPGLQFLQTHYPAYRPPHYTDKTDDIQIIAAENIYSEIESAAGYILHLTRTRGYRFNEIAVLASTLEEYEKSIAAIFGKYDIPAFIDTKSEIIAHPLIELVRSALNVLTDRWSYESVFRFLKTGMTGIPAEEIDLIENYVLAFGIRGSKWQKPWGYGFNSAYELFEEEKINELRLNIVRLLAPLSERLKAHKKYSVIEICTLLFAFLENIGVTRILNGWIARFNQAGDILKSKETIGVWNKLTGIMDKMAEILGQEKATIDEFIKILDSGLMSGTLGLIPPSLDQVIIGDLKRSRLPAIKALLILGANEGLLPAKQAEESLLSGEEKDFLDQYFDIELKPHGIATSSEEHFLIYNAFSKPSEFLYISYYLGGLDGKAGAPSPVVLKLKKIFSAIETHNDKQEGLPLCQVSAYADMVTNMRSFVEQNNISGYHKDICCFFLHNRQYQQNINRILLNIHRNTTNIALSSASLGLLYGNTIHTSVSRLEKYIKCPFSYFAQYNLKAAERKLYEIENLNLGNLFHDALDGFSKRLDRGQIPWRTLEQEQIRELALESIEESLGKEGNEIFKNSPQYQYFAKRAGEIASKSIGVVLSHMKRGNFDFRYSETVFGEGGDFEAIKIQLNSGVKLFLEGRIDRVDTLELDGNLYVKIIDYKSGGKLFSFPEIYYGLQLQLLVYLFAFIKKYREKLGKEAISDNSRLIREVLPAAVLYFKIDNPMLNFDTMNKNDSSEDAISKKYKMSGVVLDHREVIRSLDNNLETISDIIPVGIKTSGEAKKLSFEERPYREGSMVLTIEDFEKLMAYTFGKAEETAERFLTGEISARPYKMNQATACGFCLYKPVCRFDPVLDSGCYEIMTNLNQKEAILKIQNKNQKTIDK